MSMNRHKALQTLEPSHRPHGRLRMALAGCLLAIVLGLNVVRAADRTPDPWDGYNAGVRAYANKDYTSALSHWQDLSLKTVPGKLRKPVWFQLGNAQFRLGEPLEETSPEEAVELWRRSCEAYKTVLVAHPRDDEAAHNLELVQRRLARLLHRLGNESFKAAADKPLDPAINLLRSSVENLVEATALAPTNAEMRQDRERSEKALLDKLRERALQAEAKGDQSAKTMNQWANREAEDQYRAAIEDLAEAQRPRAEQTPNAQTSKAQTSPAAADEARVRQKLADLLTRTGQAEQKQAKQESEWNPDEALNRYDAALEHFQEAQQVQPNHEKAQRGEREVREAMEALHMREGKDALKQGKESLAQSSPRAAPLLTSALGNFEAAKQLNEGNVEARAGAEEARKLLPQALALQGKSEMKAGDQAEPDSPSTALGHYEESEKAFQQALNLKPGQKESEQGLKELEPKLAKAREKVQKEAEAQAKKGPPAKSLKSLLGLVNERDPRQDLDRQRQRGQKNNEQRPHYPDW